MGFIPEMPEGWHEKLAERDRLIAVAGFDLVNGWFGKLCSEFYEQHGFHPCWHKDGKLYGHYMVLYLLDLEEPYGEDKSPVEAGPWLVRKEELKLELGINYG